MKRRYAQQYARIPNTRGRTLRKVRGAYGSQGAELVREEDDLKIKPPEEPSPLQEFFSTRFWQALAVDTVGGVVSAVAIYYAMKYVEKRERKGR